MNAPRLSAGSMTLDVPPKGYRMPAEWEPHAATWVAWPHYRNDWPGKFEPVPWVYAEIIRYLSRHERVEIIVNNATSAKRAKKVLGLAGALNRNVRFHRWPTNRVWTRDSGCTFIVGPSPEKGKERATAIQLAAIKWRFNAWAKYRNWQHDETIGGLMAKAAKAPEFRPICRNMRTVLEGGSLDVNGRGTLLTTEECLLSKVQQRNPAMKKADYERVFADYLGISKVVWLGGGVTGDDTHGHVDDISRFVAPDTVVTVVEQDRKDPNYRPLMENLRRLKRATNQDGRQLNVVEVPLPGKIVFKGHRLPASYANFYIANGLVIVPVFNSPNDRTALDTISALLPGRETVPIYCGDLIWGFGAIHCMTQQQPEVHRE